MNQNRVSETQALAKQALGRAHAPALRLEGAGTNDRMGLERRIANGFARQYGARIGHFLPLLLSLDLAGRSGAIAGFRCAAHSGLFLEQYLDSPVEQAVSGCFRQPVDRGQIVEIGNLVSLTPGAGKMLFAVLPMLLDLAGVRWVTCTATPQVRAMLTRLGFPIKTLCVADPAVLGRDAAAWGNYYESGPTVIAGDVREALRSARLNRDARRLQRLLMPELVRLAAELRNARR